MRIAVFSDIHANPKELLTLILPPADVQVRLLGGVFQRDDSPELAGVAGVAGKRKNGGPVLHLSPQKDRGPDIP
ncbi:MAG: hypothetical protein ACLFRY_13920 [Spirochaetia bacterium]